MLRWFQAEEHVPELKTFMLEMMASSQKVYHVLDLFGASQKFPIHGTKLGIGASHSTSSYVRSGTSAVRLGSKLF